MSGIVKGSKVEVRWPQLRISPKVCDVAGVSPAGTYIVLNDGNGFSSHVQVRNGRAFIGNDLVEITPIANV